MNEKILNGELKLLYPTEFEEMTEEEFKKYFTKSTNRWGVIDHEGHFMVSVGWTNQLGLMSFMTDVKSVLAPFEKNMRKTLTDYQRTGELHAEICSGRASGFTFEFTANDKPVRQYGNIMALKVKKRYYIVTASTGNTDNLYRRQVFDGIVSSFTVI